MMGMRDVKTALTIAGSDSGGGAGIVADIRTFSAFGVHALVAITAITAQNTREVTAVHEVPPEIVYRQIEAVATDIGIDAAKTGMLSSSDIIRAVSRAVEEFNVPLVVDPVMIAKSGARLLREDAVNELLTELFPRALVVTPNRFEAERIVGHEIRSLEDAREAAREIHERYGPEAVIVKGGHLEEEKAVDVLFYRGQFYELKSPRLEGCTHGTGCSFSAAITANIALGKDLLTSVRTAKKFIELAIDFGNRIGHGSCPVNHIAWMEIPAERWRMYETMRACLDELLNVLRKHVDLIPEVGINMAYALPRRYVRGPEDFIALEGRITRGVGRPVFSGEVKFGASRHLARALSRYMESFPEYRCVLNVRYSEDLIGKLERAGLRVSFYDRREEPEEIKFKEGATVPWGIGVAIERSKGRPDVIYHLGDWGKEPMVLIFGKDPFDVLKKLRKVLKDEDD